MASTQKRLIKKLLSSYKVIVYADEFNVWSFKFPKVLIPLLFISISGFFLYSSFTQPQPDLAKVVLQEKTKADRLKSKN